MVLLISLFTFLNTGIYTNSNESNDLLIVRADYGISKHHKTYMNFFQLDENNKLDLVAKVKMRNGVVLMPVRKISFDQPVVVNYYVKNKGEIVNGECHTLTLGEGGRYELNILLEGANTSLEIKQSTKYSNPKTLEITKGIHFSK